MRIFKINSKQFSNTQYSINNDSPNTVPVPGSYNWKCGPFDPLTHSAHHLPLATTTLTLLFPPLPQGLPGFAHSMEEQPHSLPAGKPGKAEAWVVLRASRKLTLLPKQQQSPESFTSMRATIPSVSGTRRLVGISYGLGEDSPWSTFLSFSASLSFAHFLKKC